MLSLFSPRTLVLSAATAAMLMLASSATFSTAQAASSPSFNCYHARNSTEHAICSSWWLKRLDRRLAYWYGRALYRASFFDTVRFERREQRRWLRYRNACRGYKRCIARKYRQRIRVLRNRVNHV